MNSKKVKQILILYRPGTDDDGDSEVAEALAALGNDSELELWFANHCALSEAFRSKFRQISVPKCIHAASWHPTNLDAS